MSCSFCSTDKILNTLGWEKGPLSTKKGNTDVKGGKVQELGSNAFSEAGNGNRASYGLEEKNMHAVGKQT